MTEENRYNNLLASTHKKNKKGYDNNEFDDYNKFFFFNHLSYGGQILIISPKVLNHCFHICY